MEAEVIVARAERPHDASIDAIDQLRVQRISTPPNSRVKTLIKQNIHP